MYKKVATAVVIIIVPVCCAAYIAIAIFFAPQMLLFSYYGEVDGVGVYSEYPLSTGARESVRTANGLVASSPLFRHDEAFSPIFLTRGGWRWKLLSAGAGDAFAFTRPSTEAIIVNRSDFEADRVWNGSSIAGERSLSSVIAHERTHTLIRRRFGMLADKTYPMWVREGYCDYVAHSSTLSDEEAARLRGRDADLPALAYYEARQRVTAVLEANGGSVQALFDNSVQAR